MVTSPTGNRGFTLLELMFVMAITVLLSGAAAVALRPALEDARLRAATRMVVAGLRYARSYAVAHHTEAEVVVEVQTPALSVQAQTTDSGGEKNWETLTTSAGRRRVFPPGIRVIPAAEAGSLISPTSLEEFTVTFSMLGRTDSTELLVSDAHGNERDLVVDGVTGRCGLAEEEQ